MSQFKVGDKVRCIQPKSTVATSYDLDGDTTYTVSGVNGGGSVKLVGKSTGGYSASRFVLVEAPAASNTTDKLLKQLAHIRAVLAEATERRDFAVAAYNTAVTDLHNIKVEIKNHLDL